ncbi:MAG TPA: hypothetical protein VIG33_12715, partial [Pseudobdellovibrionaceae bacterium]
HSIRTLIWGQIAEGILPWETLSPRPSVTIGHRDQSSLKKSFCFENKKVHLLSSLMFNFFVEKKFNQGAKDGLLRSHH